jgi:phosphoglycerate dehydrogenase-like enzyme
MRLAIIDDYEKVASKMGDWNRLGSEINMDIYPDHLTEERALVDRLYPYDILIIMRERTPFPRSLIEQLPNLKLLVTTGPGNRSVDLAACTEKKIVVCGTESAKSAAAELTWALILSTLRRIPQMDRTTREGHWGDGIGTALNGKVLGVLGLGRIGTQISRVGLAFGMQVVAWSQNLTPERASGAGVVRVEKDELFKKADIITIHLVLSDRTRQLVGAHEIGLMKPSAYLINTSRGPIIEEKALIAALNANCIAGAGLDVFETEPLPPNHPFLTLSNTVVTPHIGYVTRENFQTFFTQAAEDIVAWLNGQPVRVLNSKA